MRQAKGISSAYMPSPPLARLAGAQAVLGSLTPASARNISTGLTWIHVLVRMRVRIKLTSNGNDADEQQHKQGSEFHRMPRRVGKRDVHQEAAPLQPANHAERLRSERHYKARPATIDDLQQALPAG
jgi:hypothetical protein